MMLAPETYYKLYIRGKNQEELMVIIKELKEEIIKLQNIIKQPNYLSLYKPDEKTIIACYKEYLDLARGEFLKKYCL